MKPIFTIHEGKFLVGDHTNRKLGRKYSVWAYTDGSCCQVRDLNFEARQNAAHRGVQDRHRDFSTWIESLGQLETLSK